MWAKVTVLCVLIEGIDFLKETNDLPIKFHYSDSR